MAFNWCNWIIFKDWNTSKRNVDALSKSVSRAALYQYCRFSTRRNQLNLTFHGLLTSNPFGATALPDWPLIVPVILRSLSITA